ncbi:MAG: efflux RND transporter periplasmic adaptor subunit [Chthoniobacterales bacterium]
MTRESRNKIIAVFLALLIMGAFVVALGLFKKNQITSAIKQHQAFQMPADAVTSIVVKPQPWEDALEAVGSLSAAQGVMLSADLPGIVMKTPLQSGAMVKKGDLLVQLDTRQEEAQLHIAQSKLVLAQIKIERATDLASKNVIAKSALDDVRAEYDGAVAAVDEIKAIIARKTVTAPFDGMLGLCQINEGQYLKSGDPIVPLNLLDVIHVNFSLPQQNIGQLNLGQPVRVKADGIPHENFLGTITAINSEVDSSTRNIQVQATIINDKLLLRGGMFAKIEVLLPTRKDIMTLPVSAINYAPYGDSVFVIEKMKKPTTPQAASYLGVRDQAVTLGATRGDQVEILTGLKAGDEVVSSGVFKLRPGGAVKVNNVVQPGNNPAPKPADS